MEVLWVAAREENPPRPLRDRMDPLTLPDHVLIRQYRLSRPAIVFLADNLSNDLKRETRRSTPLPVVLQIMAALRFYASGSFQMVVGGTLGVSQSSISRVVRDVSNALCRRARQFIKFPATNEECIRTKQQLFDIAGFPNVLGAVDGTHIAIKVICDATLRVTDLVAKWPGSTHDSFILMNSGTGIKFNEGEMPDGWLLGDSGYTLRPWLMTPILHPATEPDERYSRAQRKTRSVVERCIGVFIRFPLDNQQLHMIKANFMAAGMPVWSVLLTGRTYK
ncbi:putative nuclease HARBI1 [Merluccius polli]|uniref:Putative nuclease HARBI1 n=1 Tax=Merluccius polli TaxID=89951 RepID=A0AA47P4R0_MERPO|nr:putative nuclease HARBI1 [Merluccius polli]